MKEKQIEEMENIIDAMESNAYPIDYGDDARAESGDIAERLYNAGYRKQSVDRDTNVLTKWISVEDRLPEKSGKYLVCTKNGNVYQTKFYSYPENIGGHWGQKDKGRSITHWMPLPDAPKKGE